MKLLMTQLNSSSGPVPFSQAEGCFLRHQFIDSHQVEIYLQYALNLQQMPLEISQLLACLLHLCNSKMCGAIFDASAEVLQYLRLQTTTKFGVQQHQVLSEMHQRMIYKNLLLPNYTLSHFIESTFVYFTVLNKYCTLYSKALH